MGQPFFHPACPQVKGKGSRGGPISNLGGVCVCPCVKVGKFGVTGLSSWSMFRVPVHSGVNHLIGFKYLIKSFVQDSQINLSGCKERIALPVVSLAQWKSHWQLCFHSPPQRVTHKRIYLYDVKPKLHKHLVRENFGKKKQWMYTYVKKN